MPKPLTQFEKDILDHARQELRTSVNTLNTLCYVWWSNNHTTFPKSKTVYDETTALNNLKIMKMTDERIRDEVTTDLVNRLIALHNKARGWAGKTINPKDDPTNKLKTEKQISNLVKNFEEKRNEIFTQIGKCKSLGERWMYLWNKADKYTYTIVADMQGAFKDGTFANMQDSMMFSEQDERELARMRALLSLNFI